MKVASIGYQQRSVDELVRLLESARVDTLIDVRDRAWSQRPEYRKQKLADKLAAHGINYVHLRVAGNPTRPRKEKRATVEECRHAYLEHLAEHPEAVEAVAEYAGRGVCAVFCYERETADCHRGELLKALAVRADDLVVVDLAHVQVGLGC